MRLNLYLPIKRPEQPTSSRKVILILKNQTRTIWLIMFIYLEFLLTHKTNLIFNKLFCPCQIRKSMQKWFLRFLTMRKQFTATAFTKNQTSLKTTVANYSKSWQKSFKLKKESLSKMWLMMFYSRIWQVTKSFRVQVKI